MTHPQLIDIDAQLDATERRAHTLAAHTPPELWHTRPTPERWSISDGVQHLVLTIDAFLPRIDEAIRHATRPVPPCSRRFRHGIVGRVLLWMLEPPYRYRVRTGPAFIPTAPRGPDADLADLMERHAALRERLALSDGLALDRHTLVSPFDARVRYSLFTTYCVIAAHERRHLWQVEKGR